MRKPALTPLIATLYELQQAALDPVLSSIGIGWTTFQLLSAISGEGTNASQANVARALGISAPTLSESVQNHVKQGFIRQELSETDRRTRILVLSPRSERLMVTILEAVRDIELQMVKGIAGASLRESAEMLEKCIANLEAILPK